MAVLIYTEISDLALDRIQSNVATDPPFTAAEIARHINEAYVDVFQISGGGLLRAAHDSVWTALDVTVPGSWVNSVLRSIEEIVHVWSSLSSTISGGGVTHAPLERVEYSLIAQMRAQAGLGTYLVPKLYSVTRQHTAVVASIPTLRLDVYPHVASRYFPIDYIPPFSPIAAAGTTTPSVSEIESRDIALLAAARMAPLIGRAELVPSIIMDLSERTKKALDAKLSAMLDARQDR